MIEKIPSQPVRSWRVGDEVCPLRQIRQGWIVTGRVAREVWLDSRYPRPTVDGVPRHTSFAYIVEWMEGGGMIDSDIFFGDDLASVEEARKIVGQNGRRRIDIPPLSLDTLFRPSVGADG